MKDGPTVEDESKEQEEVQEEENVVSIARQEMGCHKKESETRKRNKEKPEMLVLKFFTYLFLIFINDIVDACSGCQIALFADDVAISSCRWQA